VIIFLVLILLNLSLGAFCAQYVVESWAPYAVGHPIDVPFFPHAMVIGLFLGELTIPAAVITFVIMSIL